MGLKNMGLGFIFTARDFASGKLNRLSREFSALDDKVTGGAARMNTAFKQIGLGFGMLAGSAVVLGSSLALANTAGEFEQGLAAVGAVTRATTTDLTSLHHAAIQAGIATQFSPTEAVEGLTSLATAGQTARQSIETLVPVLDLAAGSLGQLGVAQAAEAVVGTLNAFGMAAEKSTVVTDKLLRITQLSNFQARDFGIGLSKAAAMGATYGQNLNDVLITLGLLRNRNIDASSSATAYREATRRLGADLRAQQAITGAGVALFDEATGKMRSIVDVTSDFAKATEDMTDKERNRRVNVAFGARGLLTFNAIQKAAFTTIQNGAQVTLKGAKAIAALREQMSKATGTAAEFREKLLDTFQGQKTLLSGTLQTWAVALGEPFARVFKPAVKVIVGFLNTLLVAFQKIPDPIKTALAGIVTALAAIVGFAGIGLIAKGVVGLLGVALKGLGITAAGLATAFSPVIVVLGILAAAFVALKFAYQKNLGGLADFIDGLKAKFDLFGRALKQLFSQGGFSNVVRDELARTENQGVKTFAVNIWRIVERIKGAWDSLKTGFVETFSYFKPIFDDFGSTLKGTVGEVLGLFGDMTKGVSGLPFDTLKEFAGYFGSFVGHTLGKVLSFAIKAISRVVRIFNGVVKGFRSTWQYIGPAFSAIAEVVGQLATAFADLLGLGDKTNKSFDGSTETWRTFGEVLGKVLGGVVTFISYLVLGIVNFVAIVVKAISSLKNWLVGIGETITHVIADYFTTPLKRAQEIIQSILDSIARGVVTVLNFIPSALLPESVLRFKTEIAGQSPTARPSASTTPSTVVGSTSPMASAVEATTKNAELAEMRQSMATLAEAVTKRKDEQNLTAVLQIDGETLGRAQLKAGREAATRSLSPLAEY